MIAEITYTKAGDKILMIDHTFVDPVLRGQGIAAKLVDSVVKLAIQEKRKLYHYVRMQRKCLMKMKHMIL